MNHDLKILPGYIDPVIRGAKRFEVRRDDRWFLVGDRIILREWDGKEYTGRRVYGTITYVLRDRDFPEGIKEGYVVFGF